MIARSSDVEWRERVAKVLAEQVRLTSMRLVSAKIGISRAALGSVLAGAAKDGTWALIREGWVDHKPNIRVQA